MLKIAHIINSMSVGGAERLIVTLADMLQQYPAEMTIITLRDRHSPFEAELKEIGVRMVSFPGSKLINAKRFRALMRYIKNEQFDVLHTHLTSPNILGALIGKRLGIPVVTSLHNMTMSSQSHLYHGRLETYLLRNVTSQVLAVGWGTAEAHQQRLSNRDLQVVPNAVKQFPMLTAAERHELRQSIMPDPNHLLVLAVGRLHQQKAFHELIEAFQKLLSTQPNCFLAIAGSGELEAELQAQIEKQNLTNCVRLLGLRDDISKLMRAADIYAFSSHWEGLPVSLLEAMGSGLPVVGTAVGDVARVAIPGTALLVDPHRPDELARALEQLVANPPERKKLGQMAQTHIESTYGAAAWTERLLDIYQELAHKAGALS